MTDNGPCRIESRLAPEFNGVSVIIYLCASERMLVSARAESVWYGEKESVWNMDGGCFGWSSQDVQRVNLRLLTE